MWTEERAPNVVLLRDPRSYTSAMYLQRALETLCNVKTIQAELPQAYPAFKSLPPRARKAILDRMFRRAIDFDRAFRHVDLLLVVDPIRLGFVPAGFADRAAYYAIDSHLAFEEHRDGVRVADYDHVFVAQKDDVHRYADAGCKHVEWLPLGFDPAIHRPLALPKTRDMVYVGHLWYGKESWQLDRWNTIHALHERLGLEIHNAFLQDMVQIYSQSKIVVNKALKGDVNMRVFETLGCGAFLLTDRIENGLSELYTDGRDLRTYRDVDEAIELARYYLEHGDEREAIAREGYRRALAHDTYAHRAAAILRGCLGYAAPGWKESPEKATSGK